MGVPLLLPLPDRGYVPFGEDVPGDEVLPVDELPAELPRSPPPLPAATTLLEVTNVAAKIIALIFMAFSLSGHSSSRDLRRSPATAWSRMNCVTFWTEKNRLLSEGEAPWRTKTLAATERPSVDFAKTTIGLNRVAFATPLPTAGTPDPFASCCVAITGERDVENFLKRSRRAYLFDRG